MLKDVPTYKLVKELELRKGIILIALEPLWKGDTTRKNKREKKTIVFSRKEDIERILENEKYNN